MYRMIVRKIAIAHSDKIHQTFCCNIFRSRRNLSLRMQAEVVISAALVVLAIAISAALMAVCIVVGSAFVSITFALTGRSPQLIPMRDRRPPREPREEPDVRPPEAVNARNDSDLASDIMSNAAEGIVVYDREMRCQVWNRFMENLTGLRAEEVLGKRAA